MSRQSACMRRAFLILILQIQNLEILCFKWVRIFNYSTFKAFSCVTLFVEKMKAGSLVITTYISWFMVITRLVSFWLFAWSRYQGHLETLVSLLKNGLVIKKRSRFSYKQPYKQHVFTRALVSFSPVDGLISLSKQDSITGLVFWEWSRYHHKSGYFVLCISRERETYRARAQLHS